jgi:ubiquitin-protein ligase
MDGKSDSCHPSTLKEVFKMTGLLDTIIKALVGEQTDTDNRRFQSSRSDSRSIQNHRNTRIENEAYMIAPRFAQSGGIIYDQENMDWLVIPKYPLPERWKERWCQLMVVFPETYPETPPIGFYLNRQFHLKSGEQDNHFTGKAYHGAPDLTDRGWYWYCVTMDPKARDGWSPSADYRQPDNFWTFLNMVRESLTNDF